MALNTQTNLQYDGVYRPPSVSKFVPEYIILPASPTITLFLAFLSPTFLIKDIFGRLIEFSPTFPLGKLATDVTKYQIRLLEVSL